MSIQDPTGGDDRPEALHAATRSSARCARVFVSVAATSAQGTMTAAREAATSRTATGRRELEQWLARYPGSRAGLDESRRVECAKALTSEATPRIALLVLRELGVLELTPRQTLDALSMMTLPDSFRTFGAPLASSLAAYWLYRRKIDIPGVVIRPASETHPLERVQLPIEELLRNEVVAGRINVSLETARGKLAKTLQIEAGLPVWKSPGVGQFQKANNGTEWKIEGPGPEPPLGIGVHAESVGSYLEMGKEYLARKRREYSPAADEAFALGHYSVGNWLRGVLKKGEQHNEGTFAADALWQSIGDVFRFDQFDPVGKWPADVEAHGGRLLVNLLNDESVATDVPPPHLVGWNVNQLAAVIPAPVNSFLAALERAPGAGPVTKERLSCVSFEIRSVRKDKEKCNATFKVVLNQLKLASFLSPEKWVWILTPK